MMDMVGSQGMAPYLIVFGFLLALFLLYYIRINIKNIEVKPSIEIGNGQTIGMREEQDDYFSTVKTNLGTIAVLADGISGLANGKLASTIAVTTFIREFSKLTHLQHIESFFRDTARKCNREILTKLKGSNGGTTIVVAIIDDQDYLYWGAVGDSMITIFRKGEFINVNHKHTFESVLEERFLAGDITVEQARANPMRKRLINYLGYEAFKNIEIGHKPIKLQKGDKVLLCSDGIYDGVTEIEMENILFKKIPPYDAAQEVIETVERKRLRNQDNATIIILEKN